LTWTISPLTLGAFATALAGSGANALLDAMGNPLGGGSGFSQNFKVLLGDFNDDGAVSSADLVGVNNATVAPYNISGSDMSSMYCAWPVTLPRPSFRGTAIPMMRSVFTLIHSERNSFKPPRH